jgi:hypothetical protein
VLSVLRSYLAELEIEVIEGKKRNGRKPPSQSSGQEI